MPCSGNETGAERPSPSDPCLWLRSAPPPSAPTPPAKWHRWASRRLHPTPHPTQRRPAPTGHGVMRPCKARRAPARRNRRKSILICRLPPQRWRLQPSCGARLSVSDQSVVGFSGTRGVAEESWGEREVARVDRRAGSRRRRCGTPRCSPRSDAHVLAATNQPLAQQARELGDPAQPGVARALPHGAHGGGNVGVAGEHDDARRRDIRRPAGRSSPRSRRPARSPARSSRHAPR
jgi:hypothetical protein